jgi:hypothetical protein
VWHLPAWGFGTSYGSDLFLHWSLLSIQPLEACSLLLEHFVASSIVLLEPSVEHSRSASLLYQVLAHYINKGQILLLVPYLVHLVLSLIVSSDLCVIIEHKP